MLPCQHSFCRSCLERLAENDGRWGRCPQCRQLFRIPFNGVGSFDVNRTIAQLLDTFPKQMERPVLKAKCGNCRKEEIITTCEHCKEACLYFLYLLFCKLQKKYLIDFILKCVNHVE